MTVKSPPSTLPALLAKAVMERAAHPAVVMQSAALTYAELEQHSARMARALLASGAGKGTRIALLAPDGIYWLTCFLACLRIGALLSLASTLCTPAELVYVLRRSDIQILLGARRFLRHDYAKTLGAALPGLENSSAGDLQLDAAPYLRSIWLDDAAGLEWAGSIAQLIALADTSGAPDATLLAAVEQEVTASEDAVIVYTSGSTSQPKAVVHTQRTLARHPPELAKLFLLKPGDRMMPLLPAFWLGGLAMALEVLSVGATLVYPDSPETSVVLDTLEKCNVNRVNGWGDMLITLREAAIARGIDVDAIVGLGPFRDASGALIPLEQQSNMLGMSESFAVHSAEPLDVRLPETKSGASGRTVNGYERRVVNPESGVEVEAGEVGELHLRGGGLMSGFYKVPREAVFTSDGFYPTGDLVRIDSDGYLYFVARRGDMIKTRAANVSRLEVENALRALPEVETAVVAGLADAQFGQRVAAAVALRTKGSVTEDALKSMLRETLSSYKIPRNIVFVDAADIPRTATGKVRLFAVAEMIQKHLNH